MDFFSEKKGVETLNLSSTDIKQKNPVSYLGLPLCDMWVDQGKGYKLGIDSLILVVYPGIFVYFITSWNFY